MLKKFSPLLWVGVRRSYQCSLQYHIACKYIFCKHKEDMNSQSNVVGSEIGAPCKVWGHSML